MIPVMLSSGTDNATKALIVQCFEQGPVTAQRVIRAVELGYTARIFAPIVNGAGVSSIIESGQTGVLDRGYQAHHLFDQWQLDGCHFFCRIKETTHREIIQQFPVHENSYVFFDAMVLLGTPNVNQTKKPVHLVGYTIDGKSYWVATDRFDLLAEQVALVYKLRWDIESFFAWWKRDLKAYHLFARSKNGLMCLKSSRRCGKLQTERKMNPRRSEPNYTDFFHFFHY